VGPRQIAGIGLPFWMAGGYGTPVGLARAISGGAVGIQVGTAFALCRESGMADTHKYRLLEQAAREQVSVRTDGRASPTGFPFKIAELDGTLSEEQVYADRQRICDLGVLRSAYRKDDTTIGYRCPSEPVAVYEHHGGRPANTDGRRCLCNALLATAGLAQQRPDGHAEPAIVTSGEDYTGVRDLVARLPAGQRTYTARDVVTYLLGTRAVLPRPSMDRSFGPAPHPPTCPQ